MADDPTQFDDAPISRRQFVRLSAATGGALALPGAAGATVTDECFGATYQYTLNHTPEGYAVPTLVEFSDPSGVAAFEALGVGEAVHTTTEPASPASPVPPRGWCRPAPGPGRPTTPRASTSSAASCRRPTSGRFIRSAR